MGKTENETTKGNTDHINALKQHSESLRRHCLGDANTQSAMALLNAISDLDGKLLTHRDPQWTSWKEQHAEPLDLRGADFSHCWFQYVEFTEAHMEGAVFDNAMFFSCSFNRASMRHASFRGAMILRSLLPGINGADCRECDFTGATLGCCRLHGTNFQGANFSQATIDSCCAGESTSFDQAQFAEAKIRPGAAFGSSGGKDWVKSVLKQLSPEQTGQLAEKPAASGCFIATACYGAYDHPAVQEFRWFRDARLSQWGWGRRFIETYYRLSPPMADFIRERPVLAATVRRCLLAPILRLVVLARKGSKS